MSPFNETTFKRENFTAAQIAQLMANAEHDLSIARKDAFPEVAFTYSYQALLKAGMCLIAHAWHARVRSVPGHHVVILEAMAEILKDPGVADGGNAMRSKRNLDLYGGGVMISEKEAKDYLKFVADVIKRIQLLMPGKK